MLSYVTIAMLVRASASTWSGAFTITIEGGGIATGPGPSTGKWNIAREAKGTIVLDRTFRGAGIARTPDSKNLDRYETWIADTKQPIEMRIHDLVTVRGPLFAKNEIRFDTIRYHCPQDPSSTEWQPGKVGSAILQVDHKTGKFEFDMPRFYARAQTYFKRDFVEGPKSWTSQKPIVKDEEEYEFEIIHGLVQPKEWFKLTGPFRPDQKEIVIERKFTFGPPLGSSILNQKVPAAFKLVLRKGGDGT